MSTFEYASALISIVVGLALARVLGGFGAFLGSNRRSFADWIVAAWCLALSLITIVWWMIGWQTLRALPEISLAALGTWTVATALLYLAAYLLVPNSERADVAEQGHALPRIPRAFFVCLALHFASLPLWGLTILKRDFVSVVEVVWIATAIAVVCAAGAFVKTERGYAIHLAVVLSTLAVSLARNLQSIG